MATNLAYKKPTQMSTISYDNATKFGPMNAVDGNRNSDIKFQSCAATIQEMHAWWQVDLQAVYLITDVVITNRGECCGELEGVADLNFKGGLVILVYGIYGKELCLQTIP